MSKATHRRRRFVKSLEEQSPRPGCADLPTDTPARRDAPEGRNLLDRILNTPQLEQVVPRLQPELLHRVIESCGLEDSGEIVALATPEQLARVFDLDLWRAGNAGLDERFDADRFGVWLEVLLETGAAMAARKLAAIDVDLVIAGLSQHAIVYDRAAVSSYETTDGDLIDGNRAVGDKLDFDVGAYRLVARRADSWEAIVEVLTALDLDHTDYFQKVLQGCRALSNSGYELDGLDDLLSEGDQDMFDLSVDRERRREGQGYVTPAQARAFLQMSRELRLHSETMPPANPLARAYFRAIEQTATADASRESGASGHEAPGSEAQPATDDSAEAVAAVFEVLLDAGVLSQPPRALLSGPEERAPRLGLIRTQLEFALYQDNAAYTTRNEELAYLGNALMAGCSIQARPFKAQEASDAAIAICNLGLENWPTHWLSANVTAPPISFLIDHDLISVFQVGWKVLYQDVCIYSAEQLIRVLDLTRYNDRDIQMGLDILRVEMAKHWRAGAPWRARDALEVIAILDMPAWAALLAMIDECPTLHAGAAARNPQMLSVNASDFEFISENSQIASVRDFMLSLPEILRS